MAASSRFVVVKDTYRNSVELMTVSEDTKKIDGVVDASVMMATDANLELLVNAGFIPAGDAVLQQVSPADMLICIKIAAGKDESQIAAAVQKFVLSNKKPARKSGGGGGVEEEAPVSIREGFARAGDIEDANKLVLVSVPGEFATAEALKALKQGASVFLFSNNVELDDENFLKEEATARNLLVMGPDCGTAMLNGVSFGFVNKVKSGRFGLVGASGTGTQEVMVLIDRFGEGVKHAVGVGGRDLDIHVGGKMMIAGIRALQHDPDVEVIVLVSKPPAADVAKKVLGVAAACGKPVVVNFLGADAASFPDATSPNLFFAHSMEEAAVMAIAVGQGIQPSEVFARHLSGPDADGSGWQAAAAKLLPTQNKVRGLYCGGTLTKEAMLFLKHNDHKTSVIDLGDDEYTRGKPHPMIEPLVRNQHILEAVKDPSTAVILGDVVLGYGSHEDPAGLFVEAVHASRKLAAAAGRDIQFVAHVCGSDLDYQNKAAQEAKLRAAGVHLASTNVRAARLALSIATRRLVPVDAPANIKHFRAGAAAASASSADSHYSVCKAFNLVNAGLASFTKPLDRVVQLDWQPPAQSKRLPGLCQALLSGEPAVNDANQKALAAILGTRVHLKKISTAGQAIKGFAGGRKLVLHSGPPNSWTTMSGPMKGAVIGAAIYEGWADDVASATRLCESGAVEFAPNHHHSSVGPMAGIVSPSMPLLVVEDQHGRETYCNLNEGLGKVLRFGANSAEVVNRLKFMERVVGPTLQRAVEKLAAPVDLTNITAQALQMGDECHNRNAAATGIFTRAIASALCGVGGVEAQQTFDFLGANDHFFLNFSMATCKLMLDNGHGVEHSSIVTAMARNGYEFGIRMSGTGDEWFTAPAPYVKGLLFPGFSQDDACPDMGDSAITETAGIGGFAMAASPAIVRFVGGDVAQANAQTMRMRRITQATNSMYTMPSADFAGTPTGIDARLVVETGVAPVINTGIAHKEAGVGQIGAGIVHAPLKIFSDAILSLSHRVAKSSLSTPSVRFLRLLLK